MLAKRVGCDDPEELLRYWLRGRAETDAKPETDDQIPWKRQCSVTDQRGLVIVLRLLDRVDEARVEAVKAADAAVEYLLGSWRSTTRVGEEVRSPAWWRMGNWDHEYLTGMSCALSTGREDAVRALATYPAIDLIKGTKGRKSLAAFCLFIAQVVRDGRKRTDPKLCDMVTKGNTAARRLLGEACAAYVSDGPVCAAEVVSRQFVHHATKRSTSSIVDFLNFEGSILYHLLRREGHAPVLNERERDYLLAFPGTA